MPFNTCPLIDRFLGAIAREQTDRFREGFSDACGRLVGAATMAGIRKAPRDETAGRFATALVRVYGDLAVAGD